MGSDQQRLLRVSSANLLHGRHVNTGQVLETDLRAAARSLEADVVGLQEVDCLQERSGSIDQARVVADELGARWWRFAATIRGAPGGADSWTPRTGSRRERVRRFTGSWAGETDPGSAPAVHGCDDGREHAEGEGAGCEPAYGIALVSRLPVLEWRTWTFPPSRMALPLVVPGRTRVRFRWVADEPRAAIAAVVEGPAGPLTVATTHLSFVPGANVRQLRRLTAALQGMPGPHVLVGDFNLPGRLPVRATGWRQLVRVPTYPVWNARVQFDHVLTSAPGVRCIAEEAIALPVSDHLGLRAELRLPS